MSDNAAALIAAMGNKGSDMSALAPLLAAGGGLGGANGIWPIALLALLGRNGGGLFGGGDNAGAAASVESAVNTNAILSNLADLKAAVPLAEAQGQLALAGAQSDITQQTQASTLALTNQLTQAMLATQAGFANTGDKVDTLAASTAVGFGAVNSNVDRNAFNLSQIIKDDGEKTRSLITANQIAELNRIAQERQDEIIELRNEQRRASDRHGIEIAINNNQNQNQLQFQQQAQVLQTLAGALADVSQVARATNQSLIIGNTGMVRAGDQTANPTNVRA